MDTYGYSFLAAVIMLVFGQSLIAGLCFLAGIIIANFPSKKRRTKGGKKLHDSV